LNLRHSNVPLSAMVMASTLIMSAHVFFMSCDADQDSYTPLSVS